MQKFHFYDGKPPKKYLLRESIEFNPITNHRNPDLILLIHKERQNLKTPIQLA